jgi:phosphatidate cytidylyltransferase
VDPSKTLGGLLGNFIGAAVGVGLLWVAVPSVWSIAAVVALVVVLAVACVWGDLTDSFIRTAFRTEARSTLLLGYGGVIDRVKSLLMAVPFCYYALILAGKLVG